MIFFDIDGTLLDHKGAELTGIKKFYDKYEFSKLAEFEELERFWVEASNKNFNRFLNKELTFEEQRANRIIDVFANFNIEVDYKEALNKFEEYLTVYEDSWRAYEDVITCLEELKDKELGIISNGDHEQQLKKLEKIGVKKYFKDVITAGEVGVAKPNFEIFKIACQRNGVKIEESFYIGDDIKCDIIPCNENGMRAIFINRTGKEVDKNIVQIENFVELNKIIR